ncbi:MAG: MBL fold metallo-hydrolase [Parvularcula sp.]|nr:MBL fold metallo-hydrolase [Parvularcula sp.]
MRHALSALAIIAMSGTSAFAQRDFDQVEIKTTEVAEGVYMLEGAGGNIGLSVGADGAFVIDDQFAPLSGKIMAAIAEVTDKPVEFVINTHYHGDHTGGNEAFGEAGAHIVAHDNVRKRMKEPNILPDGSTAPPSPDGALPIITFSEAMSFHWNGQDIHVWHQSAAHTDGDAVIYFKDANVVHMGDLMINGGYPFVDINSGGVLSGYVAYYEKVLSKVDEDVKIIPGHGALASKADLESYMAMLNEVRSRIQAEIDAGKTEDEAVAADPLSGLNEKWGQGFISGEAMTRAAYKSLTAEHQADHDH